MDLERNGFINPYPDTGEYTMVERFRSKPNPGFVLLSWGPARSHEIVLHLGSEDEAERIFEHLAERYAPGSYHPSITRFDVKGLTITPDMLSSDLPSHVKVGFRPSTPASAEAMLRLGFDADAQFVPYWHGITMTMPEVIELMESPISRGGIKP